MTITELGAIGELVGGVAVIASLLLITDLLPGIDGQRDPARCGGAASQTPKHHEYR